MRTSIVAALTTAFVCFASVCVASPQSLNVAVPDGGADRPPVSGGEATNPRGAVYSRAPAHEPVRLAVAGEVDRHLDDIAEAGKTGAIVQTPTYLPLAQDAAAEGAADGAKGANKVGSNARPLDPGVTQLGGTGGATCEVTGDIGCDQQVQGTTFDLPNNISTYSCIARDESGPEEVLVFIPAEDGTAKAELTASGDADLDLFVLEGACSSTACLAYGDSAVEFNFVAGTTYYIVIDGFQGGAGDYILSLSCVPIEDCTDGVDNDRDGLADCDDPDCATDPACPSACCFDGECVNDKRPACEEQGGIWFAGEDCADFTCPPRPACPDGTLYGQPVQLPNETPRAGVSDTDYSTGKTVRYESFAALNEPICDVHWWGFDFLSEGRLTSECTEDPTTFNIAFYKNAAAALIPGEEVCAYQITVSPLPVGIPYGQFELNEYHVDLPTCCDLSDGWVSIQGTGGADCWFWWASSGTGDARACFESGGTLDCSGETGDTNFDLAVCLTGGTGRSGACCRSDGACADVTAAECERLGGLFQGPDTACEGDANANGINDACEDEPCQDCGGTFHWVDHCPGGLDSMPTSALIGIDTNFDCQADTNLVLSGPVYIARSPALDDSSVFPGLSPVDGHKDVIDTEMVSLDLTGAGVTLRAGAGHGVGAPLNPTLGAIVESPGDAARADSFFDVFVEVDLGGTTSFAYNKDPMRVKTVIDCLPPDRSYFHPIGCTPLYDTPTPGPNDQPVANLVTANHSTFPTCGDPATGDCLVEHDNPFCNDAECCRKVCAQIPGCCAEAWSANCVEFAKAICPVRPVEIDQFENAVGELEITGGPFNDEVVSVSGSMTVEVYFEGDTEGSANDDGLTPGLDEVETLMTDLQLAGNSSVGAMTIRLNPNIPSTGGVEEKANFTPGVLDVPPFGPPGTTADSFFDIFFEIEVGGQIFHTIDPKRMSSVITHKPPGQSDVFFGPDPVELYDANGRPTGIFLGPARNRPRPPVEIDHFDFSVGEFSLIDPLGNTTLVTVSGATTVAVFFEGATEGSANDDSPAAGFDEVRTRMTELHLTGTSAFGPVLVTLHPSIPSFGEIEETANVVPGVLDVPPFGPPGTTATSFFDIFFRIDVGDRTFFTRDPKRMRTIITHKPPASGDVYENPQTIPLYDENGNETGYALGPGRHRPRPPVEVDHFELSVGTLALSGGPFGNGEIVSVNGATTVEVYFEGLGEGSANDDSPSAGLDEVRTRMTELNLTGNSSLGPVKVRLNPSMPSTGEIEETANVTPGVLDVPPFGPPGTTANSFFDIFFEIEVGGQTFHTREPKRMSTIITHKPPGSGDVYENPQQIELYDENGEPTGIFLGASRHRPRPPVEVDHFEISTGALELTGGPFNDETVAVSGSTTVEVFFEGQTEGTANDDGPNAGLDEVQTRMTELNLSGSSSLGPVHVRLNPNRPSTGEIEETVNFTPGVLDVPPFGPPGSTANSFFDIFFEIEVGGRRYFTLEPKRMSTIITHKPPGPGDVYINPQSIELFDANGNATGIFLGASRHRPRPPVEVDHFDFSVGELELSGGPFVNEIVPVHGSTTVEVYFEGFGEGSADDDGGVAGLDEVNTRMTGLHLTGNSSLGPVHVHLNPDIPSTGVIEETANVTPGILDVPPFGPPGTTADSFFDVFFQIDVGDRTYFTIRPKRMRTRITHKPPGPGDIYESPTQVQLFDADGNATGIFLGANRHRPRPPVEIDQFNFTVAELELVGGPFDGEVVHVSGPTTVEVYFEGLHEGEAFDNDVPSDGRDEVRTRMTALDLTGGSSLGPVHVRLNPNIPSTGEIEETANLLPGVLDVPPFGPPGTTADSFFDVFFEIEVGGRKYFTIRPKRMSSRISHKPPAAGDFYVGPQEIELYDMFGHPTGIFLGATRHRPRPPVEVDRFAFTLGELQLAGGPLDGEVIEVSGPTTVEVYFEGLHEGEAVDDDVPPDGRDEVRTRMTDMHLTGSSSLGPVTVRLNPDIPSTGEIEETANLTAGVLDVPPFAEAGATADSFFDVFFEIELGDRTFFTRDPKRMRSRITHKPPAPADVYEGVQEVELFDQFGRPTGIFLSSTRHRPRPPVEVDRFELTVGELQLVGGPFEGEIVEVSGPTTVEVYFEGRNEGDARDNDSPPDGREEVRTRMTDLHLTGNSSLGPVVVRLNPDIPSTGEIEETENVTPGVLDVPPFGPPGTTADSFFDVFFEIEVAGRRFFTIRPKHMSSRITHKPPAPGDVYEGVEEIELFDQFGRPTGIFLSSTRHRPRPPVEVDRFDFTIGRLQLLGGPFDGEVVEVTGPTTVEVYFEGRREGDANDNDVPPDGRDEVRTRMTDMHLTGTSALGPVTVRLNPNIPSTGEIEETENVTRGVLDVPPFGPEGTTADSFFDVFFEIEVAGQKFYTIRPKRMSSRIRHKPPAPGDIYEGPQKIELVNAFGLPTGIFLGVSSHRPRPPVEIDRFEFALGRLQLIGGPFDDEIVEVSGPTTVAVLFEGTREGDADDDDSPPDGLDEVKTRMLDMHLTGNSSIGPVIVRLNPDIPSTGEIEETTNATPGLLEVPPFAEGTADSFFDVFVEIEVAGRTYHTIQPKRMRTRITHKPPAPGDVYEGGEPVELYDEFGRPTGVVLGTASHRPRPPVEVDVFDFAFGKFLLSGGPLGEQGVEVRGLVVIAVFFDGVNEGDAVDDDAPPDELDEVRARVIDMHMTGESPFGPVLVRLNPDIPSTGEIEETENVTPGVLDVPPFGPPNTTADSFFDILVDVRVGERLFHTDGPLHLRGRIRHKPPAPGDVYEAPEPVELITEFGYPSGIFLSDALNRPRPACQGGDTDDDGDVDLFDYRAFNDCMTGPVIKVPGTECARCFDYDGDNDIDERDAAVFTIIFNGSLPPP